MGRNSNGFVEMLTKDVILEISECLNIRCSIISLPATAQPYLCIYSRLDLSVSFCLYFDDVSFVLLRKVALVINPQFYLY